MTQRITINTMENLVYSVRQKANGNWELVISTGELALIGNGDDRYFLLSDR